MPLLDSRFGSSILKRFSSRPFRSFRVLALSKLALAPSPSSTVPFNWTVYRSYDTVRSFNSLSSLGGKRAALAN